MPGLRSPLALAAVLGFVALSIGIAACGDDEQATVTVTEAVTGSDSTSTAGGEGTTSESTAADGETPPADVEVTDSATFVSPTGNIGCFMDKATVRCDISERDWKAPKAPADCELDYGQGISLDAGGTATLVCAGDTVLGAGGQQLAYGQSISAGLLRCESSKQGIACRDIETGRGFSLSRENYDLF